MQKFARLFVGTALLLLFLSAAAKLVGSLQDLPILAQRNMLLRITNKEAMIAVALIELLVVGSCLLRISIFSKLMVIAWLSSCFAVYRLVMWMGDLSQPCGCLGNPMNWFPWLARHEEMIARSVLFFLLVGSYCFAFLSARRGSRAGLIGLQEEPIDPMRP